MKRRMMTRKETALIRILRSALPLAAAFAAFVLICVKCLSGRYAWDLPFTDMNGSPKQTLETLPAGVVGLLGSERQELDSYYNIQTIRTTFPGEAILGGVNTVNRALHLQKLFAGASRRAAEIGYDALQVVAQNQLPYEEYYTLLQIVEAEATGGDVKSKTLIANVVLNRVADERFPNTITEVVWQNVDGHPQFSPTADGRMGNLTITESTIQAVRKALEGEDNSQGALFFVARSSASSENLEWFDDSLVFLFEYGGHEFYKFGE